MRYARLGEMISLGTGAHARYAYDELGQEPVAVVLYHVLDGRPCGCSLALKRAVNDDGPIWYLEDAKRLTLTPKLECACGTRGQVAQGRWQTA